MTSYDVKIQTLGASARGKATEKIFVTYYFVIRAMQAFVCTEFHASFSQNFFAMSHMTSKFKLCGILLGVKQPQKLLSCTISQSVQCKLSFALSFMWYVDKVR